jgi:hypothetical protein
MHRTSSSPVEWWVRKRPRDERDSPKSAPSHTRNLLAPRLTKQPHICFTPWSLPYLAPPHHDTRGNPGLKSPYSSPPCPSQAAYLYGGWYGEGALGESEFSTRESERAL